MTGGTNLALRFNIADGSNGNSQPFGGIVARSRGGVLENSRLRVRRRRLLCSTSAS